MKLGHGIDVNLSTLIETRCLIQANSGGGKSYCVRKLLEESHGKVQHLVLDPEGEFSSLRERFDYVVAGKNGDTAADPRTAKLLAERLLELKASAIIDIYELHRRDRIEFVNLFVGALVDAPKHLWHPTLVVIDEAHVYCPQHGEAASMDAVIDLCTRGRKRGFCAVLATQRLSKLHKDAAAECNNKLIGRTGLDVDMKRVGDELGFNSREKQLMLRTLEPGEFFMFGPALSREVRQVQIGPVRTSHPKIGARKKFIAPPPTKHIRALLPKLADLPAEQEQRERTLDELNDEVVRLRRQVRERPEPAPIQTVKTVKVPVMTPRERAQFSRMLKELNRHATRLEEHLPLKVVTHGESKLMTTYGQITKSLPLVDKKKLAAAFKATTPRPMPKGERDILSSIALHREAISREHLTLLSGYKRSTRDAYIQRLAAHGFVTIHHSGMVEATDTGVAVLGEHFLRLPLSGNVLREYWLKTLPKGERKVFAALVQAYPGQLSRESISQITGYERSTRDAYLQRLGTRTLIGLVDHAAIADRKLF